VVAVKVKTSFRWSQIEKYLESLEPGLTCDMANAEGLQAMGEAQGMFKMLRLLKNLPQTLAAIEEMEQENEDGR